MKINKTTFQALSPNYRKVVNPKTQILIASSLRLSHNHIIRLKHQEFGQSKKWSTYSITRAGKVYEHFQPKYQSDFLGVKQADCKIISIVLENMGFLTKKNDDYVNWLNEICDSSMVVNQKYMGYDYWEEYTEEQVNSLSELCKYLCDEFNIPKNIIDFKHYNPDIVKFKGIVFKSNYIQNCNDVNPVFNVEEFDNKVNSIK